MCADGFHEDCIELFPEGKCVRDCEQYDADEFPQNKREKREK